MTSEKPLTEQQITQRRDAAVRRALNTPPKPHKDMKKGMREKREAEPTASEKKP